MAGRGFIAVGVVVLVSAGTGRAADNALPAKARAVLEKAETLDVYSLDPDTERDVTEERPKTGFRGWKILGKTTVQDADARKALLSALDKAVAGAPPRSKKCFEPRHGVRATAGGRRWTSSSASLARKSRCGRTAAWTWRGRPGSPTVPSRRSTRCSRTPRCPSRASPRSRSRRTRRRICTQRTQPGTAGGEIRHRTPECTAHEPQSVFE